MSDPIARRLDSKKSRRKHLIIARVRLGFLPLACFISSFFHSLQIIQSMLMKTSSRHAIEVDVPEEMAYLSSLSVRFLEASTRAQGHKSETSRSFLLPRWTNLTTQRKNTLKNMFDVSLGFKPFLSLVILNPCVAMSSNHKIKYQLFGSALIEPIYQTDTHR